MSDFRTIFNIAPYSKPLSHKDGTLLMGSCFSESIGKLLEFHKVPTNINPLGTLFNPISIFDAIHFVVGSKKPDLDFTTVQQGVWLHYQAHSAIKGNDKESLNIKLHSALQEAGSFSKKTKTIIITLGTAFVYEHIKTGNIVANCHKTPQTAFQKRLLSSKEITDSFRQLYPQLHAFENIIFTLSPVRHTKDTIPLNSVSKSILRVVCHELEQQYTNVSYFPSYELIMDDLRDYRFYKDDFIHPSDFAVNYVWEKFQETYFNKSTQKLFLEIKSIQQSLAHKPFNTNTEEFIKFRQHLLSKLEQLNNEVDFSTEIQLLKEG